MTRETDSPEWWRPSPESRWNYRIPFIADALSIGTGSFLLAGLTWTLASSDDGRIKALLWWCIGVTAAGAFVIFRLVKRENTETRYGRSLGSTHMAHHRLRDAAYERYIAGEPKAVWEKSVEHSLQEFANAFSVAAGAPCHATIKRVVSGHDDPVPRSADELEVKTLLRSAERATNLRHGIPANKVGLNTDFRHLFRSEKDNRSWMHQDLLTADLYENPHWPENPTPRNVPYRATMVWPIRKIVREGTTEHPSDLIVYGFLTIDSWEPGIFEYHRHFPLGAAYADHLLAVVWDPEELRKVHARLSAENP